MSTEMTDNIRSRTHGRAIGALAIALPLAAIVAGAWMPAWAFMWLLAWSVFFACKLVTCPDAAWDGHVTPGRTLAYLFAWPGMDTRFLGADAIRTGGTPVSRGAVRIIIGATMLWGVARLVPADRELLRGWVGLVGTVLVLHFGLFDVLAWYWQRRGIDAQPLMDAPARSRSLAEFWGRRWNRGFHRLAEIFVFRRMSAVGANGAMAVTFLASGLVHDLVVSLPARGGYGLPTLYFLIQGAGVLLERTRIARRAGLGRGLPGRAFAALFVLVPLPWLFHEPFVTRVVLPFLEVLR